jgi:hypothetical protein
MRNRKTLSDPPVTKESPFCASTTAASWITSDLIEQTLDCWQPHFAKALTTEDAIEILTNVGQLFDAPK